MEISINVNPNNKYFTTTSDAVGLFDTNIKTLILAPSGINQEIYIIPKTVTRVCSIAFWSENFKIIIFPPSVTFFETYILSSCKKLTKVIIQGNAIFEGIFSQDCSSFAIDYYGTKPVYKDIAASNIINNITVCNGYGAATFSSKTPNINIECSSYPYKNTCKVDLQPFQLDIIKLIQIFIIMK